MSTIFSSPASVLAPSMDAPARPLAKFDSSTWGEYYLNYVPYNEVTKARMEEEAKSLEAEVMQKLQHLKERADKRLELINFIDTMERLGLLYRLEEDIEKALQILHDWIEEPGHKDELDIFHASLLFRLLRQHGLYVSCDIFSKFQDENGRFIESLASDVKGMLSLYEASFVGKLGDCVMDEALTFTKTHLESIANNSHHPLGPQVSHAFYQSLHRGMPWLESKIFISNYEQDPSHDKMLLYFAKLNFNIVQDLHKTELKDFTRWWKDLDLLAKLPFSHRNRLVESYFWTLGMFFEPKYSLNRKLFIQVLCISSIMDDIYDAYGTFEELVMFTKAVERWDKSCTNDLPEYMKLCYNIFLKTFEDVERELSPSGRSQFVKYVQEEFIDLGRVYLEEAKWRREKYIPTFEEYMNKATMSAGCYLLMPTSYVGMKEANKEAFKWTRQRPFFIRNAGVIVRLTDDMAGHKFEQERNHISSAIESYMMQYGETEEKALKEFEKQITYSWKIVNEMMIKPYIVPKQLLMRILNFCRMMDVIYSKGEDGYTFPNNSMKHNISLVLTEPFSLINN